MGGASILLRMRTPINQYQQLLAYFADYSSNQPFASNIYELIMSKPTTGLKNIGQLADGSYYIYYIMRQQTYSINMQATVACILVWFYSIKDTTPM